MKHERGSTFTRQTNIATCSCGWRYSTDLSPYGERAIIMWLEHVVAALSDEITELQAVAIRPISDA